MQVELIANHRQFRIELFEYREAIQVSDTEVEESRSYSINVYTTEDDVISIEGVAFFFVKIRRCRQPKLNKTAVNSGSDFLKIFLKKEQPFCLD
jgi:hypothetical protein